MSIEDQDSSSHDYEAARRDLEKGIHRLRELTAEARMLFEQLDQGADDRQEPDLHAPSLSKPQG